jgi:hypothetical protein
MSDRKCGEGVIYSFEVENADPGGMVIDLVQTVEPTGEYTHLETRNSS